MYRQALTRQVRLFSTSRYVQKSTIEAAKETVKAADKTVADQIVKGIEKGEEVAGKAKQAVNANTAQGKAEARETTAKAADQVQDAAAKAKKNL